MPLPAPNLDDRRFQDLVDDAKRLVARRCPEWTDHNVSDPGVTLIETVASMVDQLLYRLNRVPQVNYLRFLDLIGLRPFPPSAAHVDVTFWLSAPQTEPLVVPADTPVATPRTETEDAIVFSTVGDLTITPAALERVLTASARGTVLDRTDRLRLDDGFPIFDETPAENDALLVGLSAPVPGCAVLLRFDCPTEGHGVVPADPPRVWECWTGTSWAPCDVGSDETGGFNKAGDVVLHVPHDHAWSTVHRVRAGWLRCRVATRPDQHRYTGAPIVRSASVSVIGGTVEALHAETVRDELVGISEGVPGQRFALQHRPVVRGGPALVLRTTPDDRGLDWWEVDDFAGSGPDDRHFVVDHAAGEIVFGPAVRQEDGTLRAHGAVPGKGEPLRVLAYRTGGGKRGNVARGRLTRQRDPVPFVSSVENRYPAVGGVDAETVDEAATRGPLELRTRERAVTVEDYEVLARRAAPEVARVHCVAPRSDGPDVVRVLVVPVVGDDGGTVGPADLVPGERTMARIRDDLDERRCLGARVVVEPPRYRGVTVVAELTAGPRTSLDGVRDRALAALYRYLHPLVGGSQGDGWPFGRAVRSGEVYAVLQQLAGVQSVEGVQLFEADPVTGERRRPSDRIEIGPDALVVSYRHEIRVDPT